MTALKLIWPTRVTYRTIRDRLSTVRVKATRFFLPTIAGFRCGKTPSTCDLLLGATYLGWGKNSYARHYRRLQGRLPPILTKSGLGAHELTMRSTCGTVVGGAGGWRMPFYDTVKLCQLDVNPRLPLSQFQIIYLSLNLAVDATRRLLESRIIALP